MANKSLIPFPLPVIIAYAAAVAAGGAASFDDEDFDDDGDPFEDWDDLPSIAPAGSSSSDGGGEGGIASLRSFTDALRGEVREWRFRFSLFLFSPSRTL